MYIIYNFQSVKMQNFTPSDVNIENISNINKY